MLNDGDRKVFTILCNYFNQHRSFPNLSLLQTKTNKSKADVIKILNSLADQSYIEWDHSDITTIKILRFLETIKLQEKSQQSSGSEQVHRFYNEY